MEALSGGNGESRGWGHPCSGKAVLELWSHRSQKQKHHPRKTGSESRGSGHTKAPHNSLWGPGSFTPNFLLKCSRICSPIKGPFTPSPSLSLTHKGLTNWIREMAFLSSSLASPLGRSCLPKGSPWWPAGGHRCFEKADGGRAHHMQASLRPLLSLEERLSPGSCAWGSGQQPLPPDHVQPTQLQMKAGCAWVWPALSSSALPCIWRGLSPGNVGSACPVFPPAQSHGRRGDKTGYAHLLPLLDKLCPKLFWAKLHQGLLILGASWMHSGQGQSHQPAPKSLGQARIWVEGFQWALFFSPQVERAERMQVTGFLCGP